MPIRGNDGTVVGVIQLINKEDSVFDKDDEDVRTSACVSKKLRHPYLFPASSLPLMPKILQELLPGFVITTREFDCYR